MCIKMGSHWKFWYTACLKYNIIWFQKEREGRLRGPTFQLHDANIMQCLILTADIPVAWRQYCAMSYFDGSSKDCKIWLICATAIARFYRHSLFCLHQWQGVNQVEIPLTLNCFCDAGKVEINTRLVKKVNQRDPSTLVFEITSKLCYFVRPSVFRFHNFLQRPI